MAHFAFQFESLLRYRRYRRGLVRALLAGILRDLATEDARRADLVNQRTRTVDEIRRIGEGGAMNVDAIVSRRFHVGVLGAEIAQVDHRREIVERQLEFCRSTLIEADRDLRVLERLRESRFDEFRRGEERREQIALEEAWSSTRETNATGVRELKR